MPDFVKRATFYEGQIVGAADLNLGISYDRDALARHQRLAHSWGIVDGLELDGMSRTMPSGEAYQEITVAPGFAVDGTGRAIVVTEQTRVPEDLFDDLNFAIADPDAWYPVLLQGRDAESRPTTTFAAGCGETSPTRIDEVFDI